MDESLLALVCLDRNSRRLSDSNKIGYKGLNLVKQAEMSRVVESLVQSQLNTS